MAHQSNPFTHVNPAIPAVAEAGESGVGPVGAGCIILEQTPGQRGNPDYVW